MSNNPTGLNEKQLRALANSVAATVTELVERRVKAETADIKKAILQLANMVKAKR